MVGLLHDFDYERFPTEQDHVWRGMEILRERGWPEPVIRAVGTHTYYTGIERSTPMEKGILAADELSGFVGACALVRPSKRVADVHGGVGRETHEGQGLRTLGGPRLHHARGRGVGTPLPELVALVLPRPVSIAARLGLDGAPAAELPDAPVPPAPPSV